MPNASLSEYQTVEECHAIHQQREIAIRWIIGLILAVILLGVKLGTGHVDNDRQQDINISRNEVKLQRIQVIEEKLDKLIEMQSKRP